MSSAGCVSQRQNPEWSRFWISTGDSLLPHKRPLCVCTLSRFSRVQHFVTPMDCSPPDSPSPVHGILQAKTLDCVAIPSFRGSSTQGSNPCLLLRSASRLFTTGAAAAQSLQSCLTLCDPIDCSQPGSSARGIFKGRVLEWGAMSTFRGSS